MRDQHPEINLFQSYHCLNTPVLFSFLHFQSSRKLPSLLHSLHSPKLLLPDFPLTLAKILLEITPMAFSQSSISLSPAQNLTHDNCFLRFPFFKNCIFMAHFHALKHMFSSFQVHFHLVGPELRFPGFWFSCLSLAFKYIGTVLHSKQLLSTY